MISGNKLQEMGVSVILHHLDIETLATKPSAAIGSIGVTSVDVRTGERVGTFFVSTEVSGQVNRTRDSSTVRWWHDREEVSQEAFDLTFGNPRHSLKEGLLMLNEHILSMEKSFGLGGRPQVMGNGPEFDNAIVRHACEELRVNQSWSFRANQSARTIVWLGRAAGYNEKYEGHFAGVKHHAIHDSLWEAHCTQYTLNKLLPDVFGPSRVLEEVW